MKVKESYGIVIYRKIKRELELLLVQKRYTYEFNIFVHGSYTKDHVVDLLTAMTAQERIIINNLNFEYIWRHVWLGYESNTPFYWTHKSIFDNNWIKVNKGQVLRDFIKKASLRPYRSELYWEIPKGQKKSRQELPITCAVREFEEETGIRPDAYKLYPDTLITSYHRDVVNYKSTFYIASANYKFEPIISFSNEKQIAEIGNIKWVPISQIKNLPLNPGMEVAISSAIDEIRKIESHGRTLCL
jgi:8-oxo-dGTP pyrophosphatase MutT (NUDIX family)